MTFDTADVLAADTALSSLLRLDPATLANPWRAYVELRGRGVWFCPEWETWIVSRYADVRAVAGDPRTFSSAAPMGPGPEAAAAAIRAALAHSDPGRAARVEDFLRERGRRLFMADGARHRADRERLAHVFTRRRMDALAEPLAAICAGLVEQLDVDGPVDLVGQYANLVAARGLGRVLGVTGGRVASGDRVMVMFGAGNRDPHAFDDPDSLNLDRPTASTHLAFGYGPHYCIGAPLGLREITTAVGTLLHRYTTITPAGEPAASIAAAPILRGLETLPVTLT